MIKYIFSLIILSSSLLSFGQNLEKIGSDDMVKVSGGMSANLIANHVQGQEQFRDPFAWVLSGNVNVNFLEVSLPFTFSFSNAGNSYSQPFNMTAVHPTYKNWKSHIGITSMQLSPYTYQGMNFAGAGVEYTPKKWKFKAFGGRLKKAVEYDASQNNDALVSYRRMGFGFSTEFTGKLFGTEVILFKAYDDPTSLQFSSNNSSLTAQDNVVASIRGNTTLFKTLKLKGEFATSILTRDVLAEDPAYERSIADQFVNGNQSTIGKNALKLSTDYRLKKFGIGLMYERVDPGYATLGVVYMNNDLENITLTPSVSLLKGKLNISANTGFQRNNLENNELSSNERWVGSINLASQPIKGINVSASYSNMSSFSRRNPAADPFYTTFADTLNYYQLSQNMNGNITYNFGDSTRHVLMLNGTYAQSQNITGRLADAAAFGFNVEVDSNSIPVDVYNGVFAHRIQFSRSKLGIGWTFNANRTIAMGNTQSYIGPGINASMPILKKKMNLSASTTYNRQYANEVLTNHVMNYRIGLRYKPKIWDEKFGKLSTSLNGTYTERLPVAGSTATKNLTIIANIAYQF